MKLDSSLVDFTVGGNSYPNNDSTEVCPGHLPPPHEPQNANPYSDASKSSLCLFQPLPQRQEIRQNWDALIERAALVVSIDQIFSAYHLGLFPVRRWHLMYGRFSIPHVSLLI